MLTGVSHMFPTLLGAGSEREERQRRALSQAVGRVWALAQSVYQQASYSVGERGVATRPPCETRRVCCGAACVSGVNRQYRRR
jgi:hypothetical protein